MKSIVKKILYFVMVFMITLSAIGFFGVNAEEENKKVSTMDEFLLGSWISLYDPAITPYVEQVEDFAASGMNLFVLPRSISNWNYFDDSPEFWGNLDSLAKENNIYYLYHGTSMLDFNRSYQMVKDLERAVGYHLLDEPSAAQIPGLSESFLEFLAGDPTRFPFVNLYPNYAGASNLGGSYRDYVTLWVNSVGPENMEYLYFDHYPFTQTETVRSSYFADLEVIRDVAYNNGRMKTGGFTQMGSWNGMRRPTPDMARWSVNSLLTYGLKSISHFNWVAPAYRSAAEGGEGMRDFVLSADGQKTDLYDPMRILNWQIRQLGPVLMRFDVKHAYHTAYVPNGAEALPGSFILQPGNPNDDFVYSIAYSKDDSEIYLILFNKALEGPEKEYHFNVDLETGIESLTYFKPTIHSLADLPDPKNPESIGSPEEITIDVSAGKFSLSFLPGEMKVLKIEGDVEIYEELAAPESSHKSGTYIGAQQVTFVTGDAGAEIYYTTDGSFPVPDAANTRRFREPITMGVDGVNSSHVIRAVSVRGNEVSPVTDVYMYITDASKNIAFGVIPQFKTLDMSSDLGYAGFNGSPDNPKLITDGSLHPESSCLSLIDENGNPAVGWAILDLGAEYEIARLVISFWHDWTFTDVRIEAANNPDLSDAVSLYNGEWQNMPYSGKVIDTLAPFTARYIRVTNKSPNQGNSIFTEIEVYSAFESGENLLKNTASWKPLANSKWTIDGTKISLNGVYNTYDWDRALGYTQKKYKNFIIDATMKFNITDPSAWGFAGFGLYRPEIDDIQSEFNQGYYVAIEPKGRALLWNGAKPELGPEDANIANWSLNSEFTLRIISYNETISLSVNNVPIMFVQKDILDREEGYISIHAGLIPVTISALSITKIGDEMAFPALQPVLTQVTKPRIAVERYLSKDKVIEKLGDTVTVTDSNGNDHIIGVTWTSNSYERTKTGTHKFIGVLSESDLAALSLANPYKLNAEAEVFVKSEVDTSEVEKLLAIAARLNKSDFTEESWEYLQIKIEAAESILADEFLVQSDINVGMFQLFDAIYGLVSVLDRTEITSEIEKAKVIERDGYTEYSYQKLQKAIETAEEVRDNVLASSADFAQAITNLVNAQKGLEKEIEVVSPLPAPTNGKTKPAGCKNKASLAVLLSIGSLLAFGLFAFRRKF